MLELENNSLCIAQFSRTEPKKPGVEPLLPNGPVMLAAPDGGCKSCGMHEGHHPTCRNQPAGPVYAVGQRLWLIHEASGKRIGDSSVYVVKAAEAVYFRGDTVMKDGSDEQAELCNAIEVEGYRGNWYRSARFIPEPK